MCEDKVERYDKTMVLVLVLLLVVLVPGAWWVPAAAAAGGGGDGGDGHREGDDWCLMRTSLAAVGSSFFKPTSSCLCLL